MIYLRCSLKECAIFHLKEHGMSVGLFGCKPACYSEMDSENDGSYSRFLLEVYSCYFEFRDGAIVFLLPSCLLYGQDDTVAGKR